MTTNKQGLLVIFSGPSGCGKGTVLKELMQNNSDIFYSVSATTRSPRPGEEHGVHYYFLKQEEFKQLIADNGVLEYASYCNNFYGTPKAPIEEKCAQGKDVILEIEVQGALQVMEKCPEAISIFVLPPSSEELEYRLTQRGTEDKDTVRKRLDKAKEEMEYAVEYDYVVVNDTVEKTATEIQAILTAEKCRQQRMAETIRKIIS